MNHITNYYSCIHEFNFELTFSLNEIQTLIDKLLAEEVL